MRLIQEPILFVSITQNCPPDDVRAIMSGSGIAESETITGNRGALCDRSLPLVGKYSTPSPEC
jgi:hypothetical protein